MRQWCHGTTENISTLPEPMRKKSAQIRTSLESSLMRGAIIMPEGKENDHTNRFSTGVSHHSNPPI